MNKHVPSILHAARDRRPCSAWEIAHSSNMSPFSTKLTSIPSLIMFLKYNINKTATYQRAPPAPLRSSSSAALANRFAQTPLIPGPSPSTYSATAARLSAHSTSSAAAAPPLSTAAAPPLSPAAAPPHRRCRLHVHPPGPSRRPPPPPDSQRLASSVMRHPPSPPPPRRHRRRYPAPGAYTRPLFSST